MGKKKTRSRNRQHQPQQQRQQQQQTEQRKASVARNESEAAPAVQDAGGGLFSIVSSGLSSLQHAVQLSTTHESSSMDTEEKEVKTSFARGDVDSGNSGGIPTGSSDELVAVKSELSAVRSELATCRSEMSAAVSSHKAKTATLRFELNEARDASQTNRAMYDAMQSQHRELVKSRDEMRAELLNAEAARKTMEDKLSRLELNVECVRKEYEAKIEACERKLDEERREGKRIEKQAEAMSTKVVQRQAKIEDLTKKVASVQEAAEVERSRFMVDAEDLRRAMDHMEHSNEELKRERDEFCEKLAQNTDYRDHEMDAAAAAQFVSERDDAIVAATKAQEREKMLEAELCSAHRDLSEQGEELFNIRNELSVCIADRDIAIGRADAEACRASDAEDTLRKERERVSLLSTQLEEANNQVDGQRVEKESALHRARIAEEKSSDLEKRLDKKDEELSFALQDVVDFRRLLNEQAKDHEVALEDALKEVKENAKKERDEAIEKMKVEAVADLENAKATFLKEKDDALAKVSAELNAANAVVTRQKDETEASFEAVCSAKEDLEAHLQRMESEAAARSDEVDRLYKVEEEAREKMASATSHFEGKIASLEETVREHKGTVESLRSQNESLAALVELADKERESTVDQREKVLAELKEEVEILLKRTEKLTLQLKEAEYERTSDLQTGRATSEGAAPDASSRIGRLENIVKERDASLLKLTEELRVSEEDAFRRKKELEIVRKEKAETKAKAEQGIQDENSHLTEFDARLRKGVASMAELRSELEVTQLKLGEMKEELRATKAAAETAETDRESVINEYESKISTLEKGIADDKVIAQRIQSEKNALASVVSEQRGSLSKMEEELKLVKDAGQQRIDDFERMRKCEADVHSSALSKLESTLNEKDLSLSKYTIELQSAQAELWKANEMLAGASNSGTNATIQDPEYELRISSYESEVVRLEARIVELEDATQALRVENLALSTSITEKEEMLHQKTEELETLRELQVAKDAAARRVKGLTSLRANSSSDEVSSLLEKTETKLKEEASSLEEAPTELDGVRKELEAVNGELHSLRIADGGDHQLMISDYNAKINGLEERLRDQGEDLKCLRSLNDKLSSRVAENEELLAKKSEELAVKKRIVDENARRCGELEGEIRYLSEEHWSSVKELESDLQEKDSAMEKYEVEFQLAKNVHAAAKKEWQLEVMAVKENQALETRAYETKVASLEQHIAEQEEMVQKLRAEREALTSSNREKEASQFRMKEELSALHEDVEEKRELFDASLKAVHDAHGLTIAELEGKLKEKEVFVSEIADELRIARESLRGVKVVSEAFCASNEANISSLDGRVAELQCGTVDDVIQTSITPSPVDTASRPAWYFYAKGSHESKARTFNEDNAAQDALFHDKTVLQRGVVECPTEQTLETAGESEIDVRAVEGEGGDVLHSVTEAHQYEVKEDSEKLTNASRSNVTTHGLKPKDKMSGQFSRDAAAAVVAAIFLGCDDRLCVKW